MEEILKQYLASIGIAAKKIAEIEVLGINNEEQLKAKVNEFSDFNTLAKGLKIGLGAAKALFEKFPKPVIATTTTTSSSSSTTTTIGTPRFREIMGLFATTVGLELSVIALALVDDLGQPNDDFVSMLLDPDITEISDIVDALKSVGGKPAFIKNAIKEIRGKFGVVSTAPATTSAPNQTFIPASATGLTGIAMSNMSFPEVPAGISLLSRLRVGGVLRVKPDTLVSAVRVLFTERAGYFDIIETIRDAIEARADKNGRSVPPIFLKLDSLSRSSEYADMLNILKDEGIVDRRRYASKTAKDKLLFSLQGVFADLASVQKQLEGYVEQMTMGGGMTPQMMLTAFASIASGAPNPALMMAMQPPAPTSVVAAVTAMVDRINKMFSGTKALTAAALQPDVAAVASLLDNDEIYTALGASDREEALNELGLTASADLEQIEKDLLQYILAVLEIPNKDSQSQPMYIGAVTMLGKSIVWDRLIKLVKSPNSAPRNKKDSVRMSGIGDDPGFSTVDSKVVRRDEAYREGSPRRDFNG